MQPLAYGKLLQPEIEDGYNQTYYDELVSDEVDKLLKKGKYLKATRKDAQVSDCL